MHSFIGLIVFYGDNLRKPFGDFSRLDITRAIIVIIIMMSYSGLGRGLFTRFDEISKKVKILLAVVSFFISILTIGLFLSVYCKA